jgi:hypothetical protein
VKKEVSDLTVSSAILWDAINKGHNRGLRCTCPSCWVADTNLGAYLYNQASGQGCVRDQHKPQFVPPPEPPIRYVVNFANGERYVVHEEGAGPSYEGPQTSWTELDDE